MKSHSLQQDPLSSREKAVSRRPRSSCCTENARTLELIRWFRQGPRAQRHVRDHATRTEAK